MAKMERKPRWFEHTNLALGLTQEGRDAVLALADLPILDVVLNRFADTPSDVRRALIVAGLLGNRFVCDLVDRLSQAKFEMSALAELEEGERSYRFVRGVVDRARGDNAAFSEQLFHEAAEEYRRSGQAARDLPNWPKDEELEEALASLLTEVVENPSDFQTLSTDDLAEALDLAAKRLLAMGHPKAGLALVRLVEIEDRRGNYEGAYEASARFMDGASDGEWSFTVDEAWLLDKVASVRMRLGDSDGAFNIFQRLGSGFQRLAATDPSNADWQRDLSISHSKLGDLHQARGEVDEALDRHRASFAIRERLAATDPSNARWQRSLLVSHVKLAEAGLAPRANFSAALAIATTLHEEGRLPVNDKWMLEELRRRVEDSRDSA